MSAEIQEKNHITVTESAIQELVRLEVGKTEFLRISLVSGGCSGLTYQLATDTVQTPFDVELFADDSIKIVTEKTSLGYLDGLHIDYSEDLIEAGFRFHNPNAVRTCGCGSSMSV